MSGRIVTKYEDAVVAKWRTSESRPQAFLALLMEFQSQVSSPAEVYVEVLTEGGEYRGAFTYTWDQAGQIWKVAPYQGSKANSINPEDLFQHFSTQLDQAKKGKLGFIRIFDAEFASAFADVFAKLAGSAPELVPVTDLVHLFVLWGKSLQTGKWVQYPTPPLVEFCSKTMTAFPGTLEALLSTFLVNSCPRGPKVVFLDLPGGLCALRLLKSKNGPLLLPESEIYPRPASWELYSPFLKTHKRRLKAHAAIFVKLGALLAVLKEIAVTPVPLELPRVDALAQRLLGLVRAHGDTWVSVPAPPAVNTALRFFARSFGYHLNLNKVSPWTLPRAFQRFATTTSADGAGTILILRATWAGAITLKDLTGTLLSIQDNALQSMTPFDPVVCAQFKERLRDKSHVRENLRTAFLAARKINPKISTVVLLSSDYNQKLIPRAVTRLLNVSPLNILSAARALGALKTPANLSMFPETAAWHYLASLSGSSLLKWVSRIGFDRHEF